MKQRYAFAITLCTVLLGSMMLLGAALARAPEATIGWWVFGSGGAPSSGWAVAMNDTLGQPVIGPSSGGGVSVQAGYWSAAPVSDLVLTIGVAQALSGPVESAGWPQANAVQLAISETNAAGGVDIGGSTYTLALVTEDSACDPTQAAVAANALLGAGAVAVVGDTCTGASNAAQPVYAAADVAMVSGSSSGPGLTEQGYTTTFRTMSRSDAGAVLLAEHLRDPLQLTRAAIVRGEGSTDAFSDTFTRLGGTITSQRPVFSTAEYTATLTAIQAEDPDAIYYVDRDASHAGLFSLVAHDLGMMEVIVGWDPMSYDESVLDTYAAVAGAAAERDYAGMFSRRTDDMPGYGAFNAAYQAAGFPNYGDEAGPLGAFAYDAARIIIEAIDRAPSTDPAAIRDEIAAMAGYEGVVGSYEGLNGQGDVIPQWAWLAEPLCATPGTPGKPWPQDGATGVGLHADLDWSELDGRWWWINEDPADWSLSENPGYLRIMTHPGWAVKTNLLLQGAPMGNFTITTRVMFTPTSNYQQAGLVLYQDVDNYLKLMRAYCDAAPPACLGNGIYFDHKEGGSFIGSNYPMETTLQGEAYLRVVKEDSTYNGYYSENGTTWTLVGSHTTTDTVELSAIGVTTGGDVADLRIPADFDFFTLQDGSGYHTDHFSLATSYDVYFGTAADPPFRGNTVDSEWALPPLAQWTPYFWRVVARNDCGETSGEEWEFATGGNHRPILGTVDPPSGSGPAGVTTYFTTTWSDADGWEDLKQCYFHIGDSPSIVGNVTMLYHAAKDKLWLRSDDGSAWTGGCAPGSANTMENSQAMVHCGLSTVQASGDTLAVKWAIEFKPGYEGAKKTGLMCKDRQRAKAKGKWKGTWTITP